ncbi:MAG TPA: class I SAM-dependent methyltransferase [Candidatus Aminicenantes bacterium]|nr:class I SAM-dependent methyltransferase [Candidatus Aminicenantes bacterium]
METVSRTCCPLCASSRILPFRRGTLAPELLSPQDFRITDNRYGSLWSFHKCKDCRFVFANPAPTDQSLTALYAALQDDDYGAEAENRGRNFNVILNRLRKFVPEPGKLLDVGAASGIFMHLAQERGFQVQGVEPSTQLVREARTRYGLEIKPGTADNLSPESTFQVITCLDLIEHLADPLPQLKRITTHLEPGGILVLVTPDILSLAARVSGRRWWHFRTAHVNFFSQPSLERLMTLLGMEIVSRHRYAWHFSLFYLATRLWPSLGKRPTLQRFMKRINCKIQLLDSWEIYARKV